MSPYRILLVDDEPDVLRSIGAYFEKLGHEVFRAANGEEALATFERAQPHVTILDYQLPDMSGMDVLGRLKRRHAVVLMLTGHGEIDTAVEAMRLGAETFLQKPVDMNHLQQAVEKAAEKAALRHEVVHLRSRLPNARRRMVQSVVVAVLIVAAVLLGLAIGRDRTREVPPIPVPIEGG